jgi:hypothetical protein
MAKSGTSRNPSFKKKHIEAPEKKKRKAWCGGGLRSCLPDWLLREPRCAKTHLEKLGYGLVQI